jgi:hypothetical protein
MPRAAVRIGIVLYIVLLFARPATPQSKEYVRLGGRVIAIENATVVVTPSLATLSCGGTQQFSASEPSVTWSVETANGGSITAGGLYSVPSPISSNMNVTVKASKTGSPLVSGTATVTLQQVTVNVTPSNPSASSGLVIPFTANVPATWSIVSGLGAINSATGQFAAPNPILAGSQTVIRATSTCDPSRAGDTTITLVPLGGISVAPSEITITAGQPPATIPFSVTPVIAVNWTATPALAGASIDSNGVYTRPQSVSSTQVVTIKATSSANPDVFGTSSVTILPAPVVGISVAPTAVSLGSSGTANITATVTGTPNTNVSWSLNPQVGTLSAAQGATVTYTAPASIQVIATSAADPTKTAKTVVSLTAPVPITVTPAWAILRANESQQYTAQSSLPVTWTYSLENGSPAPGTLTVNGLTATYQAPSSVPADFVVRVRATSSAGTGTGSAAVTITLPAYPPNPPNFSPYSGTGSSALFEFSVVDGNGQSDVSWIDQAFNADHIPIGAPSFANACGTHYDRVSQTLFLYNDAGTDFLASGVLGAPGIIQNSLCSVDLGSSSFFGAGLTYWIRLNITFKGAFHGTKYYHARAGDTGGLASIWWGGYGSWTVPAPVATPTFSPGQGTYNSTQAVTISTTTQNASIRYTVNGSEPTSTTGTLYTSPVSISSSTTLKAIAYATGIPDSLVGTAIYTIGSQAAAPTFSPPAGQYGSPQSVTISSSTSGATIRYTTDGSLPTPTTGTIYSTPVPVNASMTIKAIAYKAGMADSEVTAATYVIAPPANIVLTNVSHTTGVHLYQATNSITANTNVSFGGSATVTFVAGSTITLGPGFSATAVTAATTFRAIIGQ